jgi:hypothetical protein
MGEADPDRRHTRNTKLVLPKRDSGSFLSREQACGLIIVSMFEIR